MKTGYAIGRAVENTFLVRQRDRRRWRDLGLVLLTTLPLGAALLAYAWVHLGVIETGYRIARLEAELDQLVEEKRQAQVAVAKLLDPQRLARLAPKHGLSEPNWHQILFVQPASSAEPARSQTTPEPNPDDEGRAATGAVDLDRTHLAHRVEPPLERRPR